MDYLRLIPHTAKFLPPIKVTFSDSMNVGSLLNLDPKAITEVLEKDYRQWVESLRKD